MFKRMRANTHMAFRHKTKMDGMEEVDGQYLVDFGPLFTREKLLEAANSIRGFKSPQYVIWQLAKLESVPWWDLLFVADVISQLKTVARTNIRKSLIVLPGPNWQSAVDTLFSVARPTAPYAIYAGRLPPVSEWEQT